MKRWLPLIKWFGSLYLVAGLLALVDWKLTALMSLYISMALMLNLIEYFTGVTIFTRNSDRMLPEPEPLPKELLIEHALIGEAFSARMYSENPDLSDDAKKAYLWAESQFTRIARGEVDERDLIG